jgi:hypothetical protein
MPHSLTTLKSDRIRDCGGARVLPKCHVPVLEVHRGIKRSFKPGAMKMIDQKNKRKLFQILLLIPSTQIWRPERRYHLIPLAKTPAESLPMESLRVL